MFVDDAAQGAVGPLGAAAAVDQAIRMRVLAAGGGVEQRVGAVGLAERRDGARAGFQAGFGPGVWNQMRMQRGVMRVGRRWTRVVNEVAVQVDVVFGRAGVVRVAVRIQRVHQHHVHVVGQGIAAIGAQPADLHGRARRAFQAVRAADCQMRARGVGTA
ncbi:hypothetical protein G6F35_014552 [Rhizopus arrhizus]|nr:hypothetical protein G6F35_014552 [Rhizopus arrhizus]